MEKKSKSPWEISDELWEKIEPIIPERVNTHPRDGGKKPTPPRKIMNAILFVLRTGCQWKALDATGILPGEPTHFLAFNLLCD